jgi:tetratricopeptide (TPR) repeat protein
LLASTLRQASADSTEISKTLKRAIGIDPRHAGAHYQLGYEYENQGKKTEAIAEYRIAVDLAPSLIEARRALGRAAIDIKDWELAASQFRALIAWAPKDADAHYQLSVALKSIGRLAEAESELQTARKLNPSHKY